jgi:ubiquinone biosynthesis protein
MVFDDGFFPADPHPGNFFIEPGGRVGLVDFGMVGIVDEATQERLVELLTAVTGQNLDLLVDSFLDLGTARRRVDRAAPREDLRRIM